MTMRNEQQRDLIMDLYNAGNYEVLTKNTGDEDEFYEWLSVSMGIVACYILFEIEIAKYRTVK